MEKRKAGSSPASSDDDRCKLQLKAYVQHQETDRDPTPAMVSIMAPSGMAGGQRSPVDVVLVLHVYVRCMAPANWHCLLNQATKLVLDKLGGNDRLAIVPALSYETIVVSERSLIVSEPQNMDREVVTRERAVTVRGKPKFVLMSPESKATVSKLVLTSEAMRSNTPLMGELESAESILYGRKSDEKKKRGSHIIVISNSDEDMSSVLIWRFPSVHAFGFCDAHNARTMYTIARSWDSTCGILDKGDMITQAFAATIDKIASTIEPMEIKLKCHQEVVLSKIYAPRICYFVSDDKKVATIRFNARRGGAATKFVFYLFHYSKKQYPGLTVQAMYGHPPNSNKLVCDPPLVTAWNSEIAAEIARMETVQVCARISADDRKDLVQLRHEAAHELGLIRSRLEKSREPADAAVISGLAAEMREMETRLHNNYWWLDFVVPRSHQWWPTLPQLIMDKQQATGGQPGIQTDLETTTNRPLLQLRIMAKVDAIPAPLQKPQRGLPVLVQVMVPEDGLAKEKRADLDLVAVLGVSCVDKEMKNKRLKLLNKTMEFVMQKLSPKDRLAIIPIEPASAEPPARLSQMTEEGRREYTKVLSIVTSASKAAQQWREKLKKAMCLPNDTINSSGRAARGPTSLSNSLRNAAKLLDDRLADDKDRMGSIILISDSDDLISITQTTVSSNYVVHAFSFLGTGAGTARVMHHIASSSSGVYAIVNDDRDKITEVFMDCINKITSTIAVNTRVKIQCSRSCRVTLSTIESGKFKSSINDGKKSGSIFLGALYGGAARRFVAYVENVREDDYGNLSQILPISLTWQHAYSRVVEKLDGSIVQDEADGSTEVVEEIVRNEEINIISAITDPKTEPKDYSDSVLGKVKDLRRRLKVQADDVRVRPQGHNYAFAVNEESLASLASDKDGSWLSYMLSWLTFQGLCEKPPSAPTRSRQETTGKVEPSAS